MNIHAHMALRRFYADDKLTQSTKMSDKHTAILLLKQFRGQVGVLPEHTHDRRQLWMLRSLKLACNIDDEGVCAHLI